MSEEQPKIGKGTSKVQIESAKAYERLHELMTEVQETYDRWEAKNRFSSVHRHWDEFDHLVPHGVDALRCLFVLMRGGYAGWTFGVVNKIINAVGMPKIEIPDDERGRLGHIAKRYLAYADEHLPPTLIELHWAAMYADEMANKFWGYVVAPDVQGNYGGTYFKGSMGQAIDYGSRATQLRIQIETKLLEQEDQW
jgi:hypothetical protein